MILPFSIRTFVQQHARRAAPDPRAPPWRLFASHDTSAACGVGVGVFLDLTWIITFMCVFCAIAHTSTILQQVRTGSFPYAQTNHTQLGDARVVGPDVVVTALILLGWFVAARASSLSTDAADMAAQTAADYSLRLFVPQASPAAHKSPALITQRIHRTVQMILREDNALVQIAFHYELQRIHSVFVTLRTEEQRARVLSYYARGAWCRRRMVQHMGTGDPLLWRAQAAHEPSDILWQHAHRGVAERLLRALASFLLCSAIVSGAFAVIQYINTESRALVPGMIVALINSLLPTISFYVGHMLETPATHSEKQALQCYKLTAIRIFNSAFMFFFFTDNRHYLSSQAQEQIAGIIVIDALVGWTLRCVRPFSRLCLWICACASIQPPDPAPVPWSLSDRYADMIKFFTVAASFSTAAPFVFVLCAVAIAVERLIDSYDISFRWKIPPHTDHTLSHVCLQFIACAGLAHAWIALWTFQRWPFPPDVDGAKSPFRAVHRNQPTVLLYGLYMAFMALFLLVVLQHVIAHGVQFVVAHTCCGYRQRRRPLSTTPFSAARHGHYAPVPGSMISV